MPEPRWNGFLSLRRVRRDLGLCYCGRKLAIKSDGTPASLCEGHLEAQRRRDQRKRDHAKDAERFAERLRIVTGEPAPVKRKRGRPHGGYSKPKPTPPEEAPAPAVEIPLLRAHDYPNIVPSAREYYEQRIGNWRLARKQTKGRR